MHTVPYSVCASPQLPYMPYRDSRFASCICSSSVRLWGNFGPSPRCCRVLEANLSLFCARCKLLASLGLVSEKPVSLIFEAMQVDCIPQRSSKHSNRNTTSTWGHTRWGRYANLHFLYQPPLSFSSEVNKVVCSSISPRGVKYVFMLPVLRRHSVTDFLHLSSPRLDKFPIQLTQFPIGIDDFPGSYKRPKYFLVPLQ